MTCGCGRRNQPDARFCDSCGAPLQPLPHAIGGRRHLTAFFCDLVDYTRLARLVDEEDLHRIVRAYQNSVSGVIARWGGHVESYAGDGINACFGYPQAHEDDAPRAVQAGLEVLPTVTAIDLGMLVAVAGLPPLAVRIGIHTGPVVVGELGERNRQGHQSLGVAMNVAARLQRIADPQRVIISEATARLVAGLFVTEDLGRPTLKGIDPPVRAFVVVAAADPQERSRRRAGSSHSLVGREREMSELHQRWADALTGRGQTVLITGEAGMGKSSLSHAFVEDVESRQGGDAFEWRCSPFHSGTPFHPVIEALQQRAGICRGMKAEDIDAQLRQHPTLFGAGADGGHADAVALIHELVSPWHEAADGHDTSAVRRSRTLELLVTLALEPARHRPFVLLVEDVHWADPSTLDLLRLLRARASTMPVLLLLTSRTVDTATWDGRDDAVHTMPLEPLTPAQCGDLFAELAGARQVPPKVRDSLLARADGVPLFVEELTRALLESPLGESSDVVSAIPDTLQGLLTSRLDRLSPEALETMHLASALSREFRFDVLIAVSSKTRGAVEQDLDEIVRAGLVKTMRSAAPVYMFRHALVADAAYASILRADRRRLHARIAAGLSSNLPALAAEQPEILAHHFGEAGELLTAISCWRQAADNALARAAYQEAVRHCDQGLALAAQLDEETRTAPEIELTESRGNALFSMLGYAHPHVEDTFARAMALCERRSTQPTIRTLYGLWAVNVTRNNLDAVAALLRRFETLAATGDPVAILVLHANLTVYSFFRGDFSRCLASADDAVRWYATSAHTAFLERHRYGGGLYPYAYRMWCLSFVDRADEVLAAEEELARAARDSGTAYGEAISGGFRVNVARDRGDAAATLQLANEQIALARRQFLPFWEGPALCARGWARAQLGEIVDGIADIRLGLQYLDAVGLRATYPYHLSALSEALLLAGDPDGALDAARRALALSDTGLDRYYIAELQRLEGEALVARGDQADAREALTRALQTAQAQDAAWFVRRASESLARLTDRAAALGPGAATLDR